ncbi:hypothetical protein D918_09168 [Trichuris suis]|nr:hypothetical protein D918_09168 [Trichuris suis]
MKLTWNIKLSDYGNEQANRAEFIKQICEKLNASKESNTTRCHIRIENGRVYGHTHGQDKATAEDAIKELFNFESSNDFNKAFVPGSLEIDGKAMPIHAKPTLPSYMIGVIVVATLLTASGAVAFLHFFHKRKHSTHSFGHIQPDSNSAEHFSSNKGEGRYTPSQQCQPLNSYEMKQARRSNANPPEMNVAFDP